MKRFFKGLFASLLILGLGATMSHAASQESGAITAMPYVVYGVYSTTPSGEHLIAPIKVGSDGTLDLSGADIPAVGVDGDIPYNVDGVYSTNGMINYDYTTSNLSYTGDITQTGDYSVTGDISQIGDYTTSGAVVAEQLTSTDDATIGDLLSYDEADWTGGNVIYVPISGNIETAIAAATAGDTIVLAAGTYVITDDIDIAKSINVVGQGIGHTEVTCATASKNVFDIAASDVRLANMSISGNAATLSAIKTIVNLSGLVLEDLDIVLTTSGTSNGMDIFASNATIRDCTVSVTSATGGSNSRGIRLHNDSSATQNAVVNCYNSSLTVSGASYANGFYVYNANDADTVTMNLYDCQSTTTAADYGAVHVESATTNNAIINSYNCTLSGANYDANQDGTNSLTLYDTTLVNGTTSGTITYGGTVVTGDMFIDDELWGNTLNNQQSYLMAGNAYSVYTDPRLMLSFITPYTTEVDQSGSGNDMTYVGFGGDEQVNKGLVWAMDFNGSSDYGTIADTADLTFGDGSNDSAFSICVWIEVTNQADNQEIVSKWDSNGEWQFMLTASEKLRLQLWDTSVPVGPERETDAALSVGWHYVVVTYDGTGGATAMNGCAIYVDGEVVASTATNRGTYVAMEDTADQPMVGARKATSPERFFAGQIAKVDVIAEELSATDVKKLYFNRGYVNE